MGWFLFLALSGLLQASAGFRAIVIGDWGQEVSSSSRPGQEKVARGMGKFLEANPDIAYIVSTGDNFYPTGVTSVDSPRFDNSWRDVYWSSKYPVMRNMDWYISVGNHDHTDDLDELNQVSFSEVEPQWIFPWLWYDWIEQGDGFTVHWIVIDSQALRRAKYDRDAQLSWLEVTLASSSADYVVVVGHHPALNAGNHGGSSTIRRYVVPLMERYNADIYISGHDHNLQHIKSQNYDSTENNIDYVISGGGGRRLYPIADSNLRDLRNRGYELRHFEEDYGFVTLEFDSEVMTTNVWSPDSNDDVQLVYSFDRPRKRNL